MHNSPATSASISWAPLAPATHRTWHTNGSFTISLTGGHFFAPPAPPGCSLARSDEVLLCSLQTKKKYAPPEI